MSRIGRLPVVIPAGVRVEVKENNYVVVKGLLSGYEVLFRFVVPSATPSPGGNPPSPL